MEGNLALTTFTTSGVAVYVMQWLKNSKYFPWITRETARLNRWLSAFLAAVAAWGISYKWSPQHAAGVLGVLSISVPTLTVLAYGVWHWAAQFVTQETIYRATASFQLIQDFVKAQPQDTVHILTGIAAKNSLPRVSSPVPLPGGESAPDSK